MLVTAGGLLFRIMSRRRAMPCPYWLTPLLENPYVRSLAGAETLLDRADIRPGMDVLDIGCGPGRVTIPAARRVGPQGSVTALDIQPEMIALLEARLASSRLRNVRPLVADIGARPPALGRFDRVLLVCVLGEVLHPSAALRHVRGLLKEGGLLSVTEIFPDPHFQTRASLLRIAKEAGFHPTSTAGPWVSYTVNLSK